MQNATAHTASAASFYKNVVLAGKIQRDLAQQERAANKDTLSAPARRRNVFEVFTATIAAVLLLFSTGAFAHGLSSVQVGASVQFRHYELVRMLDQHFTMETSMDAKPAYQQTREGGFDILIVQ